MQSEALLIYLEHSRSKLCNCKIHDIKEICMEMVQIFTQLNDRWIWKGQEPELWQCKKLSKVREIIDIIMFL